MSFEQFKINWVLVSELAVGPAPGNLEDLYLIKTYGIKNIISLCNAEECQNIPEITEIFNYFSYPLPDHKSNFTISINQINEILDKVKEFKEFGSTYVHCLAGVERSPLICMAWLIRECSLDIETSLQYLMKVNPRTCPLQYQLNVLKDIKNAK